MTETECVEQYVRCYNVPLTSPRGGRRRSKRRGNSRRAGARRTPEAREIERIGAPHAGWCLVFDTETTTDTAQLPRFGCYEVHGLDRDTRIRLYRHGLLTRETLDTLHEAGVFYDPARFTPADIATLERYAEAHDLACMPLDTFVRTVFYKWVFRFDALCVGHNLPFDLSRLATRWHDGAGSFRGGFSLQLCSCPHDHCAFHPDVRIKTLGRFKARIRFARVKPPKAANGGRPRYRWTPGRFLDTATFGRALLGPGDTSLAGLGRRFEAAARKADVEEAGGHDQPLTPEYLDYACGDVSATWSLYQAERALYRRHEVGAPMWQIYSEASLGKAYFKELGVPRFLERHPDFPPEMLGYGMVAYYGGRSEVHVRLAPTEVLLHDFKSQYPTVNALLGLQDLLLAQRVTVRDATAEVRALLAVLTAEQLQSPVFWRRLRVLVKVRPDGDILPVRTRYGPEGLNIGLPMVKNGPPVWYALPDVVASALLTGKPPEVLEALELVPSAERVETQPWRLFGDERYTIDLAKQDFFTEVINLRDEVRAQLQRAGTPDEAEHLDGLQLALKLLANSTSYGVLVEVNQDEPVYDPQPVTVYDTETRRTRSHSLERPGPYFAGSLGALITSGGRLLLAIAERLAVDRGITYAMCDTDSMAFARPDGMSRQDFQQQVAEIREWFTPLSPYRGQPPIFEDEDVNTWEGTREPLYFLGVSAKRYVLYNRLPDGTYRIRKFSSHGVGTWQGRKDYVSPGHIPEPCKAVERLANGAGERWSYDLWYEAIRAIDGGMAPLDERGVPQYVVPDEGEWLNLPAFHRVTLSTASLLRAYAHVEGARPFSFLTVLPALSRVDCLHREIEATCDAADVARSWADSEFGGAYTALAGVSYYGPYAQRAADLRHIRRSDTAELVRGLRHRSLAECLTDYFRHREWKSADPAGVGVLPRRHVTVLQQVAIGKESNRVKLVAAEESDGIVEGNEAGPDGAVRYGVSGVGEVLRKYPAAYLAAASGVPRRTLYDLRNGSVKEPSHETLDKLTRGLRRIG